MNVTEELLRKRQATMDEAIKRVERLKAFRGTMPHHYETTEPDDNTDLHVPGAKDDSGKVRLGLVMDGFSTALNLVGEVGTFGANKYTPNGWKYVKGAQERYRDALFRHLLATEYYDSESGLPHMAHAAWNVLALLTLMENEYASKEETNKTTA